MDSKSLSHTKWKCQYHIVFIPKYRKKQLYGRLKEDVREVIKTLCQYKGVEIVEGAVCASVCMYTAQDERIEFYGLLKGEECAHDIR